MIQIICRKEGQSSQKLTVDGSKLQVSYNDYGHLCLRVEVAPGEDTLIVLNTHASERTIKFCKDRIGAPIRGYNRQNNSPDEDEMPF